VIAAAKAPRHSFFHDHTTNMATEQPMLPESIPHTGEDVLDDELPQDVTELTTATTTEENGEQHEYFEEEPAWNSQPSERVFKERRVAKLEESIIGALCTWIVDNQLGVFYPFPREAASWNGANWKEIGIALNLLLLLSLTHICFPRARRHTRKFYDLSYYNAESGRYALGWDDLLMVNFWLIVFTGLRVAVMDYVLMPLAQRAGINRRKEKVRFAEQAWIYLYYGAFWSLGMVRFSKQLERVRIGQKANTRQYIMYTSDYWLDLKMVWNNWPDREMDGLFKWYYLVQFAFWLQQILVVNIEERRKDYVQMFTHHLITCALMLTSYGYHQTRVGNVILCLMDVVDTILPVRSFSKTKSSRLC
jgi:acyl-CoA-dependent ceramide synthase